MYGSQVFDAFSQREIEVYLVLIWTQVWSHCRVLLHIPNYLLGVFLFFLPEHFSFQNDIRGLPSTTCGKAPPCRIGGCNACHYEGYTGGGGSNTMPGAVMYLGLEGEDLALRERYFHTV